VGCRGLVMLNEST